MITRLFVAAAAVLITGILFVGAAQFAGLALLFMGHHPHLVRLLAPWMSFLAVAISTAAAIMVWRRGVRH